MPTGTYTPSLPVYGEVPPLAPTVTTLHCRFGCPAVVGSASLHAARAAMEGHYWERHAADIARLAGMAA